MDEVKPRLQRASSINNLESGYSIVILGHGGKSDSIGMDMDCWNLFFHSMTLYGMNDTSSVRHSDINSRIQKGKVLFKAFIDNPQISITQPLLEQIISMPEFRSNSLYSIISTFVDNNPIFKQMNSEERKKIIQKINKQYSSDYGPIIQIPHNQSFFFPKENPKDFIQDIGRLYGRTSDAFGGIFFLRNTKCSGIPSFNNDANIIVENNPTDITLVSDWIDRFKLSVESIRILFSFISIKNSLGNEPIIRLCKISTKDNVTDKDIICKMDSIVYYIPEEDIDIDNMTYLRNIKIYQIDLESICGLMMLIHGLTMMNNDVSINPCFDKQSFEELLEFISRTDEIIGNGDILSRDTGENLKKHICECINKSKFTGSVLSYACKPLSKPIKEMEQYFKIIENDNIPIENSRGLLFKQLSEIRKNTLAKRTRKGGWKSRRKKHKTVCKRK